MTSRKVIGAVLAAAAGGFLLATGAAGVATGKVLAGLLLLVPGVVLTLVAVGSYRSANVTVSERVEDAAWWFLPFQRSQPDAAQKPDRRQT